jgi:hypothetical protein
MPQTMSPCGRSFSVSTRLITTPEPAETTSAGTPVTLVNSVATSLFSVASFEL